MMMKLMPISMITVMITMNQSKIRSDQCYIMSEGLFYHEGHDNSCGRRFV